MDDLISRQAAIDALNDVVTLSRKTDAIVIQDYVRRVNNRLHDLPSIQPDDEEANYWHEMAKSYEQTLVRLSQSIAEQPERKTKWIPVSKRVPNENKYYLTTTVNGEVYCDRWIEDNFDRTELVIAWMPLPEPYKEVDDDYSK